MSVPKKQAKKHTNASVFVPHFGCPHKCAFCNKDAITEAAKSVTVNSVADILESHVQSLARRNMTAEIAFFGGSFTAVEPQLRTALLQTANRYLQDYPELFTGIRCSTRPDCVTPQVLRELQDYNVTAIELGAQSMDDTVLTANNRGHTADDVRNAARLVKSYGFELGLQMMTGLYKDTPDKSLRSCDELIKLAPNTTRIYPTVVFPDTELAVLGHVPFDEEETVELCSEVYGRFVERGIRVIRVGLNYAGNVIGEKVISRYYFKKMFEFMKSNGSTKHRIYTDKRNISKINGHKCENKIKLAELGYSYVIKERAGAELEIYAL